MKVTDPGGRDTNNTPQILWWAKGGEEFKILTWRKNAQLSSYDMRKSPGFEIVTLVTIKNVVFWFAKRFEGTSCLRLQDRNEIQVEITAKKAAGTNLVRCLFWQPATTNRLPRYLTALYRWPIYLQNWFLKYLTRLNTKGSAIQENLGKGIISYWNPKQHPNPRSETKSKEE